MSSPIQESREHRDLAKGALINGIGILARSAKGLYYVIISRLFGREAFGLYLLAYAAVDVAGKIGGLGLNWGIMRLVVQLKAQGRDAEIQKTVMRVMKMTFIASAFVGMALALTATQVSVKLLNTPDLAPPLALLALATPLMTLTTFFLYSIRAGRRMQYEVYVRSVGEPLILLTGGLVAYAIHGGVMGIIAAQLAGALGSALLAYRFFRQVYPARGEPPRAVEPVWSDLVGYSLPLGGMELLETIKQRLDVLVIGRFLSVAHVGTFGAVIEVGNLIKKVRQSFDPIFMPIVAHLHETGERERLHDHLATTVRWISTVGLALLGPMIFASDAFLRVFGKDFLEGTWALMIFACGQLIYGTLGILEYLLSMTGHPYVNLFCSALLVAVTLGLQIVLIPRWGLTGASIAASGSIVVVSIAYVAFAYYFVRVHPFSRAQIKPYVSAGVALSVALLIRKLFGSDLAIILGVALPVYFVLYATGLIVGGIEVEDVEILGRIEGRLPRIPVVGKWIARRIEASRRGRSPRSR